MDVFDLFAKITLDSSEYKKGLDDAKNDTEGFGSKLASGLGTAAKVGGAAIAAVGTAAVAAGGYMVAAAGNAAQYGDEIDKNSQKLGISAEAYQEWDAVLQHSGTSMNSMSATFKTLSNAAQDASDDQVAAFEKLGLSMDDVASMSTEDLFAAVISGLQDMEEGTERTALATDLLGRGAMEMGALLNTSSADTQAMRDRVRELGGVMSQDAVKAAAAYQDSLQDMQTAFSSLGRNLITEFLPGVTTVMDGLTMLFSDDKEGGLAMISDGIDGLITNLTDKLPEFLDIGVGILDSIMNAITENLPKLMDSGANIIVKLVDALLDNLPELVKSGLEVIVSLSKGIADNLPELVPTVVSVILEIVEILTDPNNLSALIDAAIAIIIALADGLIEALPQLIEAVPTIILNLVNAIIDNAPKLIESGITLVIKLAGGLIKAIPQLVAAVPQLISGLINAFPRYFNNLNTMGRNLVIAIKQGVWGMIGEARQWGADLISNFINGIIQMWNSLVSTVSSVAGTVKSYLGFSEPEKGPLSNFHTYAPDMMDLFMQGIRDKEDELQSQLSDTFAMPLTNAPQFEVTTNRSQMTNSRSASQTTADMILDGQKFARLFVPYLDAEYRRLGINLARGYA